MEDSQMPYGKYMIASLLVLGAAAAPAYAENYKLLSPNGRVSIEVATGPKGLAYSVSLDGKPVILPSPAALTTDAGNIGLGTQTLVSQETRKADQVYHMVAGKAKDIADRYNETVLTFSQAGAQTGSAPLQYALIVRAYDSGAAFRFGLSDRSSPNPELTVFSDKTRFAFSADYDCWGLNQGRFDNSHEGEFDRIKASQMRNHNLFDSPLVCKTGEGETSFALAEADIEHYPASYYAGRGDGGLGVDVVLTPRTDNAPGARQKTIAARIGLTPKITTTPWRVVMIGTTPGAIAESTLIMQLGSPSRIADTSWIKPGKAAWDWWNDWAINVPKPGVNTESYKAYADFAQQMRADYILIDEGWSLGSSTEANPSADVTKPIAELDLPEVVKYAGRKGIGVWVWAQWEQLDNQMDAALAQYEAWGLKGVKVDFINRGDQQAIDYYYRLLDKAAKHHLMIDIHGAFAPTGLSRTFPNYMTQEGVLGAEYNKWGKRITATHNVTLPFTRMALGPIDYTPGGFRNVSPANFMPRNHEPMVQTTRGQAVAMYVVYDSPFMMIADSPGAYKNPDGGWADGAGFIRDVPVSWDETRVLQGDIGQYIVTARRSGTTWYLGAMTNEAARTVTIPLNFLKAGGYQVTALQDGADPTHLKTTTSQLTNADQLTLELAPSGGAVATLKLSTVIKKAKKKR
jgi:alpha-glucosidase